MGILCRTGASEVHVVSHMCRRHTFVEAQNDAAAKGDKDFVTRNNPARFVHVDQSYRGAEQILYLKPARRGGGQADQEALGYHERLVSASPGVG